MRYLFLLFLMSSPLNADPLATELQAASGERLSLNRLASGELWGSLFLSDNTLAQFDNRELIILQVDNHKPIKLVQGMRSCGAPAGKPQQVDYIFTPTDELTDWQFQSRSAPQPVLKLLGWDDAKYDEVEADLRQTVIDFPVRDAWFSQQIENAEKVVFRFVTTDGQQVTAEFVLEN